MVTLASLWLPILVSAAIVFVASSILWMALPYHRSDWHQVPNEAAFLDLVRTQNPAPGMYVFPHCKSAKEMKDPATQERWKRGPWGNMVVLPGVPSMGAALTKWFLHCVIVAVFAGYVATIALAPGANYKSVFRIVGTVALAGFIAGEFPATIWKGVPMSVALKNIFDGVIYALLTAGVFGWLWPETTS